MAMMRSENIKLLAAVVTGFAIRAPMVNRFSIWLDEAWSIDFVANRNPLQIVVDSFRDDFHPPLYYLVLKAWGSIAGYAGEVSRWPSVVVGVFAIVTTYMMVKALVGRREAEAAAWLMALSPTGMYHSIEARMYIFIAALLPLMVWALVVGRKKTALIAYAAIAYSHAMSGVLALPIFAVFSLNWRRGIVYASLILVPWAARMIELVSSDKYLLEAGADRLAKLPHWLLVAGSGGRLP